MKLAARTLLLALLMAAVGPASAQVSVGIGVELPGVRIGIDLPALPRLVPVPGYPVYYAPQVPGNYFFYDGLYWVSEGDEWYSSGWYNGPWRTVGRERIPLFLLRVPVRYYRDPPPFFRGWRADAPPRWGERWGPQWNDSHRGWDQWDRRGAPRAAPLPQYQRPYAGPRYPQRERQEQIQSSQYRWQPRDAQVREHLQERAQEPQRQPHQQPPPRQQPPQQQQQTPGRGRGPGPDKDRGHDEDRRN
jgi:hypothetical protein